MKKSKPRAANTGQRVRLSDARNSAIPVALPTVRARPSKDVVYLACPIALFSTPQYDEIRALIRKRRPRARLVEPKRLWDSTAQWLRDWPHVLPTISALVFFTGDEGLTPGVEREVDDALAAGLPVYCADFGDLMRIGRHVRRGVFTVERRPR
jgi:hypothetical protein